MGGGNADLKGPDLSEGIDTEALTEGATLVGHASGQPVLLARVDGSVHAIGAKCSHYGGPLGDGILEHDRVHCPWHHACFSVRTGEALQAPALRDVSVWDVEEAGGKIRVTGKRDSSADQGSAPADAPQSIAIIGAGAAGEAAAEMIRRLRYTGPVTLIDPDPDAPYDRPNLSKDYLAGTAPEEWMPLREPSFFADQDIQIRREQVDRISRNDLTLTLANGESVQYGALLLAPGAEPNSLPAALDPARRTLYLRSFEDTRRIIAAANTANTAVVIGASFIGLEVAASLRHRDIDVTVVAPEAIPLERVLGSALGAQIRSWHEEHGVRFRLEHGVARIETDSVVLDDGERVPCDMVVAGIGVRPRTQIAEAAGLTVDNGIVVDDRLRTSDPHIFAAGDAAKLPDPITGVPRRVEHWVYAQRMGQVAARNILGQDLPFTAAPFFWSQHYDAVVVYVGHTAEWDDALLDGDPATMDCAVAFKVGDQTRALATIFRDRDSLREELSLEAAATSD